MTCELHFWAINPSRLLPALSYDVLHLPDIFLYSVIAEASFAEIYFSWILQTLLFRGWFLFGQNVELLDTGHWLILACGLGAVIAFFQEPNHWPKSLNLFFVPLARLRILTNLLFLAFTELCSLLGLFGYFYVLFVQVFVAFLHDLKLDVFLLLDVQRIRWLGFF